VGGCETDADIGPKTDEESADAAADFERTGTRREFFSLWREAPPERAGWLGGACARERIDRANGESQPLQRTSGWRILEEQDPEPSAGQKTRAH
jgi:hypothetical protein